MQIGSQKRKECFSLIWHLEHMTQTYQQNYSKKFALKKYALGLFSQIQQSNGAWLA